MRSKPRHDLYSSFWQLHADEGGQGLVEYVLVLLLVAIVLIGALAAVGVNLQGMIDSVAHKFD